jgi:hypothetical protein
MLIVHYLSSKLILFTDLVLTINSFTPVLQDLHVMQAIFLIFSNFCACIEFVVGILLELFLCVALIIALVSSARLRCSSVQSSVHVSDILGRMI